MIADQTISVLERAIDAKKPLSAAAAREVLEWQLAERDSRRLDQLIALSKQRELTDTEEGEFRELAVTVDLLSLLHLRAREALRDLPKSGA